MGQTVLKIGYYFQSKTVYLKDNSTNIYKKEETSQLYHFMELIKNL